MENHQLTFHLKPEDNDRLASLTGHFDENIKLINKLLPVQLHCRSHEFIVEATSLSLAKQAKELVTKLYKLTNTKEEITVSDIHEALHSLKRPMVVQSSNASINTPKRVITPRNQHQTDYIQAIEQNDINFAIGPAGTGKTYLAVACAIAAFEKSRVRRIILVRPAVEAGERLGFLPGDLSQKVDPYLRPLYDALYDTLGGEKVEKLIEKKLIEIAPLAFMRGRTLNEAFIILDESQNTTIEQMKMFLTRIGYGSKAVICGDITQVDLDSRVTSGLKHAQSILNQVSGIHFTYFNADDVVRHALVQRIVKAYESSPD